MRRLVGREVIGARPASRRSRCIVDFGGRTAPVSRLEVDDPADFAGYRPSCQCDLSISVSGQVSTTSESWMSASLR